MGLTLIKSVYKSRIFRSLACLFFEINPFSICQIIEMPAFQRAQRISVYLSLDSEVNTKDLLSEMFRLNKQVRFGFKNTSPSRTLTLYLNRNQIKKNIRTRNLANSTSF